MSDSPAPQQHPIYQIIRDALQLITLFAVTYTANVGTRNGDRIEGVEQKQTDSAVKQDDAARKVEVVKQQLSEKSEEDAKVLGVTLYSTWKYLEDVALQSGNPKDGAKAAEAKRAYEDHVRKPPPKH